MNDPCDEMVSVDQAIKYFTDRMRPEWPTVDSMYDRLAAILGIKRHEAKLAVYSYAYGLDEVVDDDRCYTCSFVLSESDKERDKCPRCGRHFHDDLEDYEFDEEDS